MRGSIRNMKTFKELLEEGYWTDKYPKGTKVETEIDGEKFKGTIVGHVVGGRGHGAVKVKIPGQYTYSLTPQEFKMIK